MTGSGARDPGPENRLPPRLAESLLVQVLPLGKRGESIRGDLLEEFRRIPDPAAHPQLSHSRRSPMLMDLTDDLRTAIRMTTRNLGTSSLIVLTLAAAIAGATVGFTFADFALLRGLPVDDEDRVVSIFSSDTEGSNPRARVSGPDFLDIAARATLTIDLHEMSFVAAVTRVCPLVFSIAPLRVLSHPDLRQVLAGSGTRGSTASTRGRGALVVVQVALAVVLLTVSSLSVRSIQRIYSAPTGLNPNGVLVLGLEFNDVQYPDAAQVSAVAREVRARSNRC